MIDEATRNFLVQATLENSDGLLRTRMYVSVEVILPVTKKVLALPSTSVAYAPYWDSVFVVKEIQDEKSKKSFLGVEERSAKLGESRGDQVEIVSGVKVGEQIAEAGVDGGDNDLQPPSDLKPKPEDQ